MEMLLCLVLFKSSFSTGSEMIPVLQDMIKNEKCILCSVLLFWMKLLIFLKAHLKSKLCQVLVLSDGWAACVCAVSMTALQNTGLAAHSYSACTHFLPAAHEGLDSTHTRR